jgi:hypothetical protein
MFSIKNMLLLLFVVLPATTSFAKELPSFYEGIRPLGMGGAFTAIADDSNAIFYNPAGLSRLNTWSFEIPVVAETSKSNIDIYDEAKDVDFDSSAETANFIRRHLGETADFRFGVVPNFVNENFGVALLAQAKTSLRFDNAAFPETTVHSQGTGSAHVAMAHSFLEEKLSVGAGLKYIRASTLDETYTAQQIADSNFDQTIEDDFSDGSGFGVDLGIIYTLPFNLESTVGLSIINLGGADLGDAGEIDQQVNLGLAAKHTFEKVSWMHLVGAVDLVDIFTQAGTDDDYFKRVRMGFEVQMPILTLRAGIYQGYGTYGASLNLKFAKLEYTSYAEEVGAFAGDSADRRHVIQLALGAW